MKKTISFIAIITIILTLFLVGCDNSSTTQIDSHSWELTTVQENEQGSIIACSPTLLQYNETAKEIEITCEATDGNITINDDTNNKKYTGAYTVKETTDNSEIYDVSIDDKNGMAVCSLTVENENKNPTLIININGFTLNLQPKTN